jgi:hypothetical protein
MEGTARLGGSFGGSRRELEGARAVGAAQWRQLPAQAVLARAPKGGLEGGAALVVGGGWEGGVALVVGGGWNRYVCGSREKKNDRERIKIFLLCVLISRECVFTAIGLATNHWSL